MFKLKDFKRELKQLLTKYDAEIIVGYDDCTDTHGIYGENMAVEFTEPPKEGKTRSTRRLCKLHDGWGISRHG